MLQSTVGAVYYTSTGAPLASTNHSPPKQILSQEPIPLLSLSPQQPSQLSSVDSVNNTNCTIDPQRDSTTTTTVNISKYTCDIFGTSLMHLDEEEIVKEDGTKILKKAEEFIVYEMRIQDTTNHQEWYIFRRYSEFKQLFEQVLLLLHSFYSISLIFLCSCWRNIVKINKLHWI